jgi:lysyl endopeptidase
MKRNYHLIFLLLICQTVKAQVVTKRVSEGSMIGTVFDAPFSVLPKFSQPDIQSLLKEDYTSTELPERIGVGFEVNVDLKLQKCSYRDMGKVWALKLEAEKSKFLSIFFDEIYLPEGSELYLYNRQNKIVIGPLNHSNTKDSPTFQTGLVTGEDIVVVLVENPAVLDKSKVHIRTLYYGYKETSDEFSFGSSASCNDDKNVNCALGSPYIQQSNAVAMIIKNSNTDLRVCSATLLNNACNNLKSNILTAFHCVDTQNDRNGILDDAERAAARNFGFVFQYKSPTCQTSDGGFYLTFSGSNILSGWNQTDFILLELLSKPLLESGITYAGWDRSNTAPTNAAGIHHPAGDVMKIAIDNQPSTTFTWNNSQQGFSPDLVDGYWQQDFDTGATQRGSSGSGLFDQNNRVVGQLRGNQLRELPDCDDKRAHYGRLGFSWDGGGTQATRLSDFLSDDPSVITTNTISIPSITIPDVLCGNQQMSINNIPPNMMLVGGSIVGANLTSWFQSLAPWSNYVGQGWLELHLKPIGNTCNDPLIIRKTFTVNTEAPHVQFYSNGGCSGWLSITNSNWNTGTTYNWTVYSGSSQPMYYVGPSIYRSDWGSTIDYMVTATNACGTSIAEDIISGCNGGGYSAKPVDENTGKKHNWKMQLSPNPATNDLNVSLSDYNERLLHTLGDVKIFNMTGQVVYETKQVLDDNMRLNIQSLNNGFYILEVRGEDFTTRQRFNVSR